MEPVLIMIPAISAGLPSVSPTALISHANFYGLLGITHTQKIFVSLPDLGAVLEGAASLSAGHVSRVAMLVRTSVKPT
jgi:hypothetical protein